jgi:excisionase family DNA binding protein
MTSRNGVTMNADPLLTVADSAAYLGVALSQAYRLIAHGKIAATNVTATRGVGRGTRVRRSELERFIADNTTRRGHQ